MKLRILVRAEILLIGLESGPKHYNQRSKLYKASLPSLEQTDL